MKIPSSDGDARHEQYSADAVANRAKNEEANKKSHVDQAVLDRGYLQTSITYYRERLGFQLDFQGPDDGPFWAGVSRDGIGIMLKAIAPDVLPVQTTPGTNGPLRTRTSTAWTLMRSMEFELMRAVVERSCRSSMRGCGDLRPPMPTGMSWPSISSATSRATAGHRETGSRRRLARDRAQLICSR